MNRMVSVHRLLMADDYIRRKALEEHQHWLLVFKNRQLEVYNVYEAYLRDPFSANAKRPPSIGA
jgi:phosphorylcholine metabolism protein LicD